MRNIPTSKTALISVLLQAASSSQEQNCAPVSAEMAAAKGAPSQCRSPAAQQPCEAPQWSQLHFNFAR